VNREFLVDRRGDTSHVLLTGEIDRPAVPAVFRAIHRALTGRPHRVVINLDAVIFIESAGLAALVDGYHTAAALGIGFQIGPAGVPTVARVLAVTGLDEALAWDPVLDEGTGTAG